MITPQEISALVTLFNRMPMSQAEQLWCQAFVEKLANLMNSLMEKKDLSEEEKP